MQKMIFVNLPVADVERSAAFYAALGATRDPRFSIPGTVAAMVFSEAITVMLLSHDHFMIFSPRPVADARTAAQVLICLSEPSREAVDAAVERATALGGRADLRNRQEVASFMYGRNLEDLDGHVLELMWLDVEAMMRASGAAADASPEARPAC